MISCNQSGIHYHRLEMNRDDFHLRVDGQIIYPGDLAKMRKQGTPEGMDCIFQATPEALDILLSYRWEGFD